MSRWRLVALVAILAGTGTFIALGGAGGSVARANTGPVAVTILSGGSCGQISCFSPEAIIVNPGTTVTWTNTTGLVHTVTRCTTAACGVDPGSGTDPTFDSGLLGSGLTFSTTFNGLGTYVYYCKVHGYAAMHGTVTVVTGPFEIATTQLPPAAPGAAYGPVTLQAVNLGTSTSPFVTTLKWHKVTLVKGLKLSKDGELSGTPSTKLVAGPSSVTVRVTETVTTLNGTKKVKTKTMAEATIPLTIN
jgi:plastocyanin